MKCRECSADISQAKWCATGPRPDIKIYVKKCPSCGDINHEYDIIEGAINANLETLKFNKEVHRSWPDSMDLIMKEANSPRHKVVNALIRRELY